VKELLASGMIVPSNSPFASPVLCQLLEVKLTIKNRFPIPIIDEILDELAGTKLFTKLDMRSGYHQVGMHSDDEFKTTFKIHHGHFQFHVRPFGLTNAPATFPHLTTQILHP
jgi:hypothetical protein